MPARLYSGAQTPEFWGAECFGHLAGYGFIATSSSKAYIFSLPPESSRADVFDLPQDVRHHAAGPRSAPPALRRLLALHQITRISSPGYQ